MVDVDYTEKALKIFEVLDIKKIYYVDDELENSNIVVSDVVGELTAEILSEKKAALTVVIPPLITSTVDIAKQSITAFLDGKNDQERHILLEKLTSVIGVEIAPPTNKQASFLQNAFGEQLSVICIGPTEWDKDKELILSDAKSDNRALCIFDQNLDGKDSPGHAGRKGTNLINEISARDNDGRLFCVIISGDIDTSNELEHWEEYVNTYRLPSSKFFPLSKNRTDSEQLFAEGMHLSSLNALYDLLKRRTLNVIASASEESKRELNKINLFNLNYMVANSKKAKEEGTWQASTLFRLYDIIQDGSLKSQMIIDDYSKKFNENIAKVQSINNILPFHADSISPERYTLRYKELYESAEHTNQVHEELKVGDLFRTQVDTQTTRDYVLLAQPCDLTVRGKSGVRNATAVTLAPITIMTKKKFSDKQKSSPGLIKTGFQLEYYSSGSDDIGFVEFNKVFTASVNILDLAVLNFDGKCFIDFSSELKCPPQLHSAWQLRFDALKGELTTLYQQINNIKKLSEDVPASASLVLDLLPNPYTRLSSGADDVLPKHSYSGTILNYNLWRIGSVRPPVSAHLLDAYTKHLSRVAYDHDFSS